MKLPVWCVFLLPFAAGAAEVNEVDGGFYNATPSGILAAAAVRRRGRV